MTDEQMEPITIGIGDQTFRVRVAPEERERFQHIAQLANHALTDVLNSGVVGGPRALAMTIFQLSMELEDARDRLRAAREHFEECEERLRQINDRIEEVFDPHSGVL